jgi:hypothetical protein
MHRELKGIEYLVHQIRVLAGQHNARFHFRAALVECGNDRCEFDSFRTGADDNEHAWKRCSQRLMLRRRRLR